MTWKNMVNILTAASLTGLVAIGHTYLIIEGQNDLSPGSLVAFLGVFAALLVSKGISFGVTLLVTVAIGVVVGGVITLYRLSLSHAERLLRLIIDWAKGDIARGVLWCGVLALLLVVVSLIIRRVPSAASSDTVMPNSVIRE